MIDKQVNKRLVKGLREKRRKPSWLSRYNRKKLIGKLSLFLQQEGVSRAWIHEDFVSAVEKKPKIIVIYTEFDKNVDSVVINSIDTKADSQFKKYNINIIDVKTLLPSIKDSIFKELTQIL